MSVTLHGPAYSTYVRTARLVLEEKNVAYELNEVDLLSGQNHAPDHLDRHPWGKVPALEHDGFTLHETLAIARYVDEAFPGRALQPAEPRARARMMQLCLIMDSYAYRPMVQQLFWQEVIVPMQGGTPDAGIAAVGLDAAEQALGVLDGMVAGEFLCGAALTLADLHVLPPLEYLRMTEAGARAFDARPRLAAWWQRMNTRPSVVQTRPKLG
jgi:glutathione S-transferase